MKTFLIFLFTLHPIKAVRSLFSTPELMEYDAFEANNPQLFRMSALKGYDKKVVIKAIKKLMNRTVRAPLGLSLGPEAWESLTPEMLAKGLLEGAVRVDCYIGQKEAEKINGLIIARGSDNTDYGPLNIHSWYSYDNDIDMAAKSRLDSIIQSGWIEVQRREGGVPQECSNCEVPHLTIDNDLLCDNCGAHVKLHNRRPKTFRKQLAQILEYEAGESAASPILDRRD